MITQILSIILSMFLNILALGLGFIADNLAPESTLAQISEFSPLASLINFIKLISYIITPILIILIVWVAVKFKNLKKEISQLSTSVTNIDLIPAAGGALTARWKEILDHMGSTNEGEWKFAIIEADKLLEQLLGSSGYPGDTMGERLMNIEAGQLQTLDGLWEAHKIRNRLVHDNNYFLRYAEAKKAIQLYEGTLKELGAL